MRRRGSAFCRIIAKRRSVLTVKYKLMQEKTVLIVEDDNSLRELYEAKLKQAGLRVITAPNGEEGLKTIKALRPQVVLLDLMMPKKNGFDVLKEVKSDDALKTIRVLILSNLGQESDIKYTADLQADGYLIKSRINLNQLVERVNKELAISA